MTERGAPLQPLARLWMKTSGRGTEYFVGRLGLAKLVLLPNTERQGDDDATHVLFVTAPNEAGQRPGAPAQAGASQPAPRAYVRRRRVASSNRDKVQINDDAVPF